MWRLSSRGHELSIMADIENTLPPSQILVTIYLKPKEAQVQIIVLYLKCRLLLSFYDAVRCSPQRVMFTPIHMQFP